ncbi:uncharacterized protein METZ01_LOCUS219453 [marine metagenome]|uniref:Uncharacterized protein n=1 Tax=marine metagenome TaxID=408172 RepID=A0A382FVD7_9ZZZZ
MEKFILFTYEDSLPQVGNNSNN